MRFGAQILTAAFLIVSVPQAWAAGGGQTGGGATMPDLNSNREQTPEEKAKYTYNSGVRAVNKADKYAAAADKATDPRKKEKAGKEALEQYATARGKFEQAVQYAPSMYEAWNYVGYTHRKLGDYSGALAAYDRALTLKPSYPEAIEYRGEAYLRLKRLDDAKQAYLDLFSGNRVLADKLLGSMKTWLDTQRSAGADAAGVEEFGKWVQERSQIAGQTAALTREGAGESWR
jgi:tetratricopeptide (TPR) repeat protein